MKKIVKYAVAALLCLIVAGAACSCQPEKPCTGNWAKPASL